MSELKPCPFCGGEADTWDGAGPWHVVCTKCGTVGSPCLTEAEAIAAWNTRAERTCEIVYATGGIIARAECRDICGDVEQFTCSACGFNCNLTSWITPIGCDRPIVCHHHGTPNYCPSCGAKVVGE